MDAGANAFLTGGTENWHFYHHTNTYTSKSFHLSADKSSSDKGGRRRGYHFLNYRDYQVHVDASSGFVPALPTPGSFDLNTYDNMPYQLAAYIQDKIELSYLRRKRWLAFRLFRARRNGVKES